MKVVVTQLKTSIPHWYTAEYLEANKITPEPGAYIRSKVSVTSKKVSAQLQAEETRLAKKYPNTRLYVVPQIQEAQKLEVDLSGNTDQERVEQYVASTFSDGARFVSSRAVSYLSSKLQTIAPGASGKRLRFLKSWGTNVLSFKEVAIRYNKQGLVLIKGENKDWPKRSNGAGKTNALSLLLAILFGQTLKGQKNDQWAREDTEEPAECHLTLRDEKKRLIEIIRGRRPHKLLMKINGEDVSTGLTGKGKGETQGQIEKTIGFDLDMLLNSVYIDQTLTNGFVFGTQKARMDLVSKLCDLKRFDQALKLVALDVKKNTQEVQTQTNRVDTLQEESDRLEDEIKELDDELLEQTPWTTQAKQARKDLSRWEQERTRLLEDRKKYEKLALELEDYEQQEEVITIQVREQHDVVKQIEREASKAQALIEAGNCPKCGQPCKDQGIKLGRKLPYQYTEATVVLQDQTRIQIKLRNDIAELTEQLNIYKSHVADCTTGIQHTKDLLKQAEEGEAIESKRSQSIIKKSQSLKSQLNTTKRILTATRTHLKDLDIDRELLEYSQKAFHRSGMPLYLASSLCPLLNKAAEEYSEIFTEGKIQVVLSIIDNEFIIDIVNPHGSNRSDGQSVGESAMAGTVAAFALIEACPRTNLVILDEPGHGLDSVGAKQFAKGLLALKESGRFGTILVTTHSGIIEGMLSGEKQWVVTKQNGISTLST
jgi:DNA repair exonuclease SbcCD ATPase subunit